MLQNRVFFLIASNIVLLSLMACSPSAAEVSTATQPAVATPNSATSTDGPQPTAAPTETPAAAPAAHACDNPYLPIVQGATWEYKLTGPISDTFTHTILSVDEDSFVEQDVFATGVTRQAEWQCEHGDLIALNPPGGSSANISTENNVSVDFETTNLSGVTLPGTINPGDTWSQALTLEGTQTIDGTSFPASNQTTSDCEAIGMESVTVEAGTFQTLRVECQNTMDLSLDMGAAPIQSTLNLTGTNWYVEGIGLVKTVTTGMGLDSTTELVSYSIP